jgi:hypothetical protein
MAIKTELGTAEQNSYVSLSQAEDYFSNRNNSTDWDALATTAKESLLIEAARDLERFNYIKEKYYDTQNLSFPFEDHTAVTGNCGTPITNTSFRHTQLYSTTYNKIPEDYWKYGTVHITSGTPVRDTRIISESNVTTGSITVASAFTATPTENTKFLVLAPLPDEVYDAQCEQAIFILDNSGISTYSVYTNLGAEEVKIGDVQVKFGKGTSVKNYPIAPSVKRLLSRWIKRDFRVGRA